MSHPPDRPSTMSDAAGAAPTVTVRLDDLPAPPAGKAGWPWTEAPSPLPRRMPDGRAWPRITIVTPSYNQADFLEETLRSVILQGYPDLEYLVMDGGSTDGSVAIIERYEPWITAWRSHPDEGQSAAINEGFGRATGSILGWLNSDDAHLPHTLWVAAMALADGSADVIHGAMDKVLVEDGESTFVTRSSPVEGAAFQPVPIFRDGRQHFFSFAQPPCLWTRDIWLRAGELDRSFHYKMDREWLNRALAVGARVRTTDEVMAKFVLHPGSKSHDHHDRFLRDHIRAYLKLSRHPGARSAPTLLSALHPLQRLMVHRSKRAREEGWGGRAFAYRWAGRAVHAVRIVLPTGSRWDGAPARREDHWVRPESVDAG